MGASESYRPYGVGPNGELEARDPERGLADTRNPVKTLDEFVGLLAEKFHSHIISVAQLESYWKGASKNPFHQTALTEACKEVGIRVEKAKE